MTDHSNARTTCTQPDLWMVEAVIKPFKLDAVTRALEGVPGFSGMTVTDAAASARRRCARIALPWTPHDTRVRDGAMRGSLTSTRRHDIEVAVAGRTSPIAVAAAIARAARTGNIGDGRVFVWPIARAIRIETGV